MGHIKLAIASAAVVGFQMQACLAADPAHGQELAQRWCAGCHAVTANARQSADVPPPFAVIAHRQDFDAGRLAFFLLNPHPVMPDMGLSRNEAMDLAAYIASLRK